MRSLSRQALNGGSGEAFLLTTVDPRAVWLRETIGMNDLHPNPGGWHDLRTIGLRKETASCLIADGVNAVSDLSAWQDGDLRRIPGLGPVALGKIREAAPASPDGPWFIPPWRQR